MVIQELGGLDLAEGDCVLVPARVVRLAGANGTGCRLELETEEPPAEGELWPVLTVRA